MRFYIWLILIGASVLEVGGDVIIRKGLRGSSLILIITGCIILSSYAIIVNMMKWEFSKIFGIYVAFFALTSILFGQLIFKETIPLSTWLGLLVILCGAMIIQFGSSI
jgi:small multidrug resistance family-3 protein